MSTIAWIGTGVMGQQQAKHLVQAGHTVYAYSRHYERVCEQAKEYGFIACATIEQAVHDAEFIFVMVGYPSDVEEVFLGEQGILAHARPGTIALDMTTSSPTLAQTLAEEGARRGIAVLDAPVSGGDSGARNATLSIMVGGNQDAFARALPLLECMGTARYMGGAGCGQHTKAANQIAVAGATAAYTEAIHYAERVGIEPSAMLEAIAGGAAGSWQINNMAPRALAGDFAPGFFVKHFVKDMNIIHHEMVDRGVTLNMLESVRALYQEFAQAGGEDLGTQALIDYYRHRTS